MFGSIQLMMILENIETVAGSHFKAEVRLERVVFSFLRDGNEVERHEVKTRDLQSVTVEPDGSTRLTIKLHRDLTVPTSADESVKLKMALERILGEVNSEELRRIEAAREARVREDRQMGRRGQRASESDYEKIPED